MTRSAGRSSGAGEGNVFQRERHRGKSGGRNEKDYAAALKRLDRVIDARDGTPEADVRDVLTVLMERYEEEHYIIDQPDPLDAVRFRLEQAGLSTKDLVPYIGSRSKVSEVLSGRRSLTLKMIRALNRHLGIPAEVLLRDGHRSRSW